MKIDKSYINFVTITSKEEVHYDERLPNFGLRVRPNGKKTWVIQYRVGGRFKKLTLGDARVLTPEQAVEAGRNALRLVVEGKDPIRVKRIEARALTVNQLCIEFLDRHSKRHKTSWEEDARRIDRCLAKGLGKVLAKDLTPIEVQDWHGRLSESAPYEANRALTLLSSAYKKGKVWGFVEHNPCEGIERNKEESRDRFLTAHEFKLVWQATFEEPHGAAIRLMMLTGLRKKEVLAIRWSDIEANELQVVAKRSQVRRVPLNNLAVELLQSIHRTSSPFVFPARVGKSHLSNVQKIFKRILSRAGVSDCRIHDLRRTAASMLIQSGTNIEFVSKFLGHNDIATTRIYARLQERNIKDTSEALESQVQAALESGE